MEIMTTIFTKAIFAGIAGLGFAVLFNVPRRTLLPIVFIATIGGFSKYLFLSQELGLVWSSLFAATLVGVLSVPVARKWYTPPLVFAIPSIIPMVPGAYIYRMILGMITIATTDDVISTKIVTETIHNGIFSLFILIAISVGAGMPVIITRRQIMTSIKKH